MARLLLQRGASVDAVTTQNATPLLLAAIKGHTNIIRLLLDYGSNSQTDSFLMNKYTALHWAARGGYIGSIKVLLDAGADINAKSEQGNSVLTVAVEGGHIASIRFILESKDSINTKEAIDALHVAIRSRNLNIIELLVNYGASVDISMVYTVLGMPTCSKTMHPCVKKENEIIKFLLEHSKKDIQDKNLGYSPLHLAAKTSFGGLSTIKMLLNRGEQIENTDVNNQSSLMIAVKEGNYIIAFHFLDILDRTQRSKSTLLIQDNLGKTVLHYAILNSLDILSSEKSDDISTDYNLISRILIIGGTELVNTQSNDGKTPLHLSSWTGRTFAVKILLGMTENFDEKYAWMPNRTTRDDMMKIRCRIGRTALHWAAEQGNSEVIRVLLAAGASPHWRSSSGYNVLHTAAMSRNSSEEYRIIVIRQLLEWEKEYNKNTNGNENNASSLLESVTADIKSKNHIELRRNTALHLATRKCALKVVALLLEYGANVDSRTASGSTALHIAATIRKEYAQENSKHGRMNTPIQIISLLIKKGADINALSMYGETALIRAAEAGHHEVIKKLLSAGAKVTLKTKLGETAASLASKRKHGTIFKMIQAHAKDIDIL